MTSQPGWKWISILSNQSTEDDYLTSGMYAERSQKRSQRGSCMNEFMEASQEAEQGGSGWTCWKRTARKEMSHSCKSAGLQRAERSGKKWCMGRGSVLRSRKGLKSSQVKSVLNSVTAR